MGFLYNVPIINVIYVTESFVKQNWQSTSISNLFSDTLYTYDRSIIYITKGKAIKAITKCTEYFFVIHVTKYMSHS